MRFGRHDGFQKGLNTLLDRSDDFFAACAIITERILRQRLAQALEHPIIIDNQTEILAGEPPIGPRDRLHQRMCLHRLVDVEGGQRFDIEPRQPHGADNRDSEPMLRVLERCVDIDALTVTRLKALFHQGAMRDDVETPLFEISNLVLRLADNNLDDCIIEPVRLRSQLFGFVQ